MKKKASKKAQATKKARSLKKKTKKTATRKKSSAKAARKKPSAKKSAAVKKSAKKKKTTPTVELAERALHDFDAGELGQCRLHLQQLIELLTK